MNLGMVRVTESKKEMIEIGKEIIKVVPQKYPENIINMLRDSIKQRLPYYSENEIDDVLYISIYHYWVYGCTVDEYFYYKFYDKSHVEKKEYITLRERVVYLEPLNKTEDAHLLFNKNETYDIFKEEFKRDLIVLRSMKDYKTFEMFVRKHSEFVVKPTDLGGGRGVHKFKVASLDESECKKAFESIINEIEDNKRSLRGKESSIILEELIDQSEELAVFNPESVNGVRITTVRVNGKTYIYQPWLKIGRGGQFVTSAVFGTLDAGINVDTGIVDTMGYNEVGEKYKKHPDRDIDILGFKVPYWEELKEFAIKCADKLPSIGCVGWDFALSKKGWCIMEGNFRGDFMWQLYRNKGMKKEFEELIGWKMEKDFWWQ